MLEYGLEGLPVVVTNAGQCAEVVDYGKCCFLIEPGDFNELARYLKFLMLNTKFRHELGSKLKERVMASYSCNAFLQQYKRVLTNL
ncbi:MAG: glycosyltransferase [Spirochaetes bacterium]|nr:glycosyltransferase [Spirochaetota bacterium]